MPRRESEYGGHDALDGAPELPASPTKPAPATTRPLDPRITQARGAVSHARALERMLARVAEQLVSPEEHAARVIDLLLTSFGASSAVAARVSADGSALELIGAAHIPASIAPRLGRIAVADAHPMSDAVREEHGVYCETREAVLGAYPALRETVEAIDVHALCAVPVRHLGRMQGALGIAFREPHQFTAAERLQLRVAGARLARALAHARLYFAEQEARGIAERARAEADVARREAVEARAAAEEASRAKSDFLATVSHELRSPLNAIIGYTELLEDGIAGQVSPKQHDFLMRLRASGEQLRDLVEQLLAGARGDAGVGERVLTSVSLSDILAQVANVVAPLAARKRLDFSCTIVDEGGDPRESDVCLESDAGKLRQILVNLAVNAVKFTEHGSVAVRARAVDADVEVAVEDTGIGIEPANLSRVFEPFWQAVQGSGRALGGTGLGMSIARQYAEILGGSLTVSSTLGRGTTFVLRVPKRAPTSR